MHRMQGLRRKLTEAGSDIKGDLGESLDRSIGGKETDSEDYRERTKSERSDFRLDGDFRSRY